MPQHCRMRAFGRDLIRGGHYGQRSCEPHLKAEHMAAPTNAAYVKKALANSEPSTHGTKRTSRTNCLMSAFGGKADIVNKSPGSIAGAVRYTELRETYVRPRGARRRNPVPVDGLSPTSNRGAADL